MQRKEMTKGNVALRCALALTLAIGLVPTFAYADSLDALDNEMQTLASNCDERAYSDAEGLGSFRSFGDGCEWALDSSGALTVRAVDGALGTLPAGVWPWANVVDQVTSVVIEPGVKAGSSLDDMFNGATSLNSADLSGLNASGASTMNRMFKDCSSLVDVNLRRFDSSNVSSMSQLFSGCSSLENVDLSSIDNLSVTDPDSGLKGFFDGCTKLGSITLGQQFSHGGGQGNSGTVIFPKLPVDQGFTNRWRSSRNNRLYICYDYSHSGYDRIPSREAATYTAEKLDDGWRLFRSDYDSEEVSNCVWKVDNGTLRIKPYKESDDPDKGFYLKERPWAAYKDQITAISIEGECKFKGSINNAFGGMPVLKTADLSGLSLLWAQDMGWLFAGCPQLESVTFNSDCESSVGNYEAMFRNCTSLKSVDMSGVDHCGYAIGSLKYMFEGCTSLESVDVSGMATNRFTKIGFMFNECTALRSITVGSNFTFMGEEDYCSNTILPKLGSGYTGKWVSSADGNAYAWNEIHEFVAATYTPQQGTTDISGASIMGWKSSYTDDETIPTSVDVIVGNALLVQDSDYTLEIVHDFNACPGEPTLGKWEYVIRGKGNYTGEFRRTLYVKHVVDAPTVAQGLVYNGTEQSCLNPSALPPMVKIRNEKAVDPGNHTTYAYFDEEDADFYMWDTSMSREIALYWWIGKADAETTLTVKDYAQQYAWTGSRIEPKVKVYVPWQEKLLVEGRDYSVVYDNNIDVGTATITVWPNSNFFDGSKTVEFEIAEGVAPEPDPVVSGSWKGGAGAWWYQYSDGSYLKSCWKDIDGARYYFDDNGYAKAGWALIDGSWYWFDLSTSAMRTGWLLIDSAWYWFSDSGMMVTGWQQIDSAWYLFSGSGAMLTGWQLTGGAWYYLGGSGAMLTGWQSIGGTWYWFSGSGAMATGWRQIDGAYYYFDGSGAMLRDCWVGDYCLTGSGAMATNQWIGSYYVDGNGRWVR